MLSHKSQCQSSNDKSMPKTKMTKMVLLDFELWILFGIWILAFDIF